MSPTLCFRLLWNGSTNPKDSSVLPRRSRPGNRRPPVPVLAEDEIEIDLDLEGDGDNISLIEIDVDGNIDADGGEIEGDGIFTEGETGLTESLFVDLDILLGLIDILLLIMGEEKEARDSEDSTGLADFKNKARLGETRPKDGEPINEPVKLIAWDGGNPPPVFGVARSPRFIFWVFKKLASLNDWGTNVS